ncbi:sulfatase family protein [Shewanella woodyi]|uniref:Sulfatase n=1 Tax=Shewanella woodyi (strain ATCC 51908 / MS32) TaxID=392500 RepID=B1KD87_SHEWM|nr:arylsulfatase [Shewanella woodyi]ACA87922.1 sulfatase [Shewanella woodyi ATCC 51908]
MMTFTRSVLLTLITGALVGGCNYAEQPIQPEANANLASTELGKPNLVIIYADDLGYGDISSYGGTGVNTPNIDALAAKGLRLTDSHASAATCTPSRYSLLTGEHGFRSDAAILPGDAPLLISPKQATLPKLLKRAGYASAVIGKWHLGLGYGDVDWNQAVKPGPLEIGFDYSFLLPATGDRVPTVFLENHHVLDLQATDPLSVSYQENIGTLPTGISHPQLLKMKADPQHSNTIVNGVSRIGSMTGGESAYWIDEDFPDIFTAKAVDFIREHKDQPFFLFHSMHDIHVPRLPHKRFQGKSGMGPRGDAIVQLDWMTGQIVKELEKQGIAENTIVIFTSDNGPVLDDGYHDNAVEMLGNHKPSGPFRGGKYSAYEAGTRVPTIVYWPEHIQPKESDALTTQIDIYASMAELLRLDLVEDEAIDSIPQLDAWLGRTENGREFLVKESVGTISLRHGEWKYIRPFLDDALPDWLKNKDIEVGLQKSEQLYKLTDDMAEQHNLANSHSDRVNNMKQKLEQIIESGYR